MAPGESFTLVIPMPCCRDSASLRHVAATVATGGRARTWPGGELPAKLLENLFGVSGMSKKDEAEE